MAQCFEKQSQFGKMKFSSSDNCIADPTHTSVERHGEVCTERHNGMQCTCI